MALREDTSRNAIKKWSRGEGCDVAETDSFSGYNEKRFITPVLANGPKVLCHINHKGFSSVQPRSLAFPIKTDSLLHLLMNVFELFACGFSAAWGSGA